MTPHVVLLVTYHDSQTRRYMIGPSKEFFTWLINPDGMLVLKRHRLVDRLVIPLAGNVREIEVIRVPREEELREGATDANT